MEDRHVTPSSPEQRVPSTGGSPAPRRDGQRPLRGTDLKRFHRTVRRAHESPRRIAFVLENVAYPVNVGSFVRIADALDASLALAGTTPPPTQPTAAKVGRGKHQRVPWAQHPDAPTAIATLVADGFTPIGLEITSDAVPYHEFEWPDAVALVVGSEDHGLTARALAACRATVFVPMLGRGRSLNVHVAAAVVGYRVLLAPRGGGSA